MCYTTASSTRVAGEPIFLACAEWLNGSSVSALLRHSNKLYACAQVAMLDFNGHCSIKIQSCLQA
jgi:hypothetical protein